MKRSSLLVRMVISIFLVFLILLALVGTFYYQSSSSAIEATIEGNSQTTISQTSHFIQSYIKKLETTSTGLTQQTDVLAYAENPSQDKVEGIRDLFLTILKSDKDLKTVVLVTKSGQVISTDDSVQMKTSSDMMAEDWYQKAIHQGAKSVEKVIQGLENELVIVSGLAKGIDTAAHMAALQNGGKTIAVIGTGLDVFYPKANKRLQDYIGNDHLVLSEYGPGEQPLKFHFPARNRIIAGLCRGVIVAEAKMRSGSLITCERAMEEGRDVFAIPGSILDGLSDGCHHLIQEGAKLLTSGQDVLAEFEF
ncbi:DNA processing protein DprA [Streptococcus pneumoniae]|uniref:DNA-processing protein DprA n=2 Tax=Streptococcus pneumoniae TaxID=1313 RepID=UPI0005E89DAF|nr:DNA-processing protein DprA [Streptococcus pneumoniae]COE15110.1 DNA processing protein DprA [Streptococcus pneumoniae]